MGNFILFLSPSHSLLSFGGGGHCMLQIVTVGISMMEGLCTSIVLACLYAELLLFRVVDHEHHKNVLTFSLPSD
jgi:hypothetical protein